MLERRCGSGQSEAVGHGTPLGREDMDPIGRTFELVICRLKRGGRTGEVKQLKPWGNVESDHAHGRIAGWPNSREVWPFGHTASAVACPAGGQASHKSGRSIPPLSHLWSEM